VNLKKYIPSAFSAHGIFASVSLVFGFSFIAIVPPLWGIDEIAHFARSYQVSTGGLLPHQNEDKSYGGVLPVNLIDLNNYVYGDLINNKATGSIFSRTDVDSGAVYRNILSVGFADKDKEYAFPGSAAYSPVAYAPPAIGIFIAEIFSGTIGESIFLARTFSLLCYIALVGTAIWMLRATRLKWVVFLIGLMPMSLFQASIVNADGLMIGLALLFMAVFLNLITSKADISYLKSKISVLIIIGALIPLVKVNYIFLSAILFLLPSNIFKNKKYEWSIKIAGIGIAGVITAIWLAIARNVSASIGNLRPDGAVVDVKGQLFNILGNPVEFVEVTLRTLVMYGDQYPQQITGMMGWNLIAIPLTSCILLSFTIFLAIIYALRDLALHRTRLLLAGLISLIGVLGIFGVLYLTFTPVGKGVVDGIQGRYFIPFLMPIALGLLIYLPVKVDMTQRQATTIFSLISIFVLAIATAYYSIATH
jgi:uncharacterized membrane protein